MDAIFRRDLGPQSELFSTLNGLTMWDIAEERLDRGLPLTPAKFRPPLNPPVHPYCVAFSVHTIEKLFINQVFQARFVIAEYTDHLTRHGKFGKFRSTSRTFG